MREGEQPRRVTRSLAQYQQQIYLAYDECIRVMPCTPLASLVFTSSRPFLPAALVIAHHIVSGVRGRHNTNRSQWAPLAASKIACFTASSLPRKAAPPPQPPALTQDGQAGGRSVVVSSVPSGS